jgi:hypothetical protein
VFLKTRRINELLATLHGGEAAHGRLAGSYSGYGVEAQPRRGYPIQQAPPSQGSAPGQVDMFHLTLSGVAGRALWRCQSSPSSRMQDAVSRFTAGRLLRGFAPGEFKFERVDMLREGTERLAAKLTKALGVPTEPTAPRELQERLIAAGLFEELAALRWGAHPYLPKVEFMPPASEITRAYLESPAAARVEPQVSARLRAEGLPGYEALLEQQMAQADASSPGRLVLEVEVGRDKIPSPERFRELLGRAVAIARINATANPPTAGV